MVYLPIDLVDVYGTCIHEYTRHGWYGEDVWKICFSSNFPQKLGMSRQKNNMFSDKMCQIQRLMNIDVMLVICPKKSISEPWSYDPSDSKESSWSCCFFFPRSELANQLNWFNWQITVAIPWHPVWHQDMMTWFMRFAISCLAPLCFAMHFLGVISVTVDSAMVPKKINKKGTPQIRHRSVLRKANPLKSLWDWVRPVENNSAKGDFSK